MTTANEMANEQQEILEKIQHFGRIDRSTHERNELAVSLDTNNGGRVLKKVHASLPKGYYFVAVEEVGSPVYALAEGPETGHIECIRMDKVFPEWCSALKRWLKV